MKDYLQRFRRYFSTDPGGYGGTPSATDADDEEEDEGEEPMLRHSHAGRGSRGKIRRSETERPAGGRRRGSSRETATSPSSSPSKKHLKTPRDTNSSPGVGGGTNALESSEEESSTTARLSRRSSVLVCDI